MGKISIIGNPNPEIGIQHQYSIFKAFELPAIQSQAFDVHQEVAHWEIYVLERGGWRKTDGNAKMGGFVTYTFNQKSLTRKGIKLIVTKGDDKGEFVLKTKPAKQPKISKIELLDVNGHKVTQPLSYMDTLIAKAYCTDMEGESLSMTLWEDDALHSGHGKINQINKVNPIPHKAIVKKGIAQARFNMAQYTFASIMANMQVAKGDKNEGKTHEYYVTAEFFGKLEASNNINLKNPAYNPHQTTSSNNHGTKTAPADTPKNKTPNKRPEQPKPTPKKETYKTPITQGAKTKAADPQGKIMSVEFVDFLGRPYKNLKFGTQIKARISTQNMKGKTIKLKIWEDDISNQLVSEKDYVLIADITEVPIPLTEDMRRKGDDWKEGSEQEYFLEVEYSGQSVESEVVNVNDSTPTIKVESGRSKVVVKKPPKEKFDKVVGLGEEAVIYVTNEIATEINEDKNGKVTSYPDYGVYNGIPKYKEENDIYCGTTTRKNKKGKIVTVSVFPTYKAYIYRGKKMGEAVKKLKQDIEDNTHENAENSILEVARHSGEQNKNTLTQGGPIPASTINKMFRIKYKTASNHSGKTSYRYRIVDDIAANFTKVKDIKQEISNGSMTIGSRSSISIDPWISQALIGCLGIRGQGGGNHPSCSEEMNDQSASNYKNIYHSLNNYLEGLIPELTGVYGRRAYTSNGKVTVAPSEYKEETKVYVLVDALPELNNCQCGLKKDGREEYYESFGNKTINYIKGNTTANKYKGLYMIAQRRQENGFSLKTPLNNPMNIKGSGDAGKANMGTHETYNGKYQSSVESFANFTSENAGFQGYLNLLNKNFPDAYSALTDNSKTINDFVAGLEDTGKKGAYATGEAMNGMSATQQYKEAVKSNFNSTLKDYKKLLECRLCKAKDEKTKNEIKEDIKLLNQLK